ncbi:hypothetical protein ACXJJ3_31090 [Kribbella sp. WER1]
MALYFSVRALNEIDDSEFTMTTTRGLGIAKVVSWSRQRSIEHRPGATDRVDFALSRARRKRRVVRDVGKADHVGCIFDLTVKDLHVGTMPFLSFGLYGEGRARRVRTFWAHAEIPIKTRRVAGSCRDLVLLGSLDNVVNEAWNPSDEAELKIGHAYPSEPSVLSRIVRTELGLTDSTTAEHANEVDRWTARLPGDLAEFARSQTHRARQTMHDGPGYATTWERRPPLHKARVVAIVSNVYIDHDEPPENSAVLARPVLIQDLS